MSNYNIYINCTVECSTLMFYLFLSLSQNTGSTRFKWVKKTGGANLQCQPYISFLSIIFFFNWVVSSRTLQSKLKNWFTIRSKGHFVEPFSRLKKRIITLHNVCHIVILMWNLKYPIFLEPQNQYDRYCFWFVISLYKCLYCVC